jgi:hypothetical protein
MKPIRLAAVALGLVAASSAFGAKKPKPFRPSLTFSEFFRQTPEAWEAGAGGVAGHLSLDARIPLDPADVATFDGETWFAIAVGGLEFDEELASDPEWSPGETSARLVARTEEGDEQVVAQLEWTSDRLAVHVEADIGDMVFGVAADEYTGEDPRRIKDETAGEIVFGNSFGGWHTVKSRVQVKRLPKLGPIHADVRAKGKGAPSEFFTDPEESDWGAFD